MIPTATSHGPAGWTGRSSRPTGSQAMWASGVEPPRRRMSALTRRAAEDKPLSPQPEETRGERQGGAGEDHDCRSAKTPALAEHAACRRMQRGGDEHDEAQRQRPLRLVKPLERVAGAGGPKKTGVDAKKQLLTNKCDNGAEPKGQRQRRTHVIGEADHGEDEHGDEEGP